MPRREVTENRRIVAASDELVDFRWQRADHGYTVIDVPNEAIHQTNRDAQDLPLGLRYEGPDDSEPGSWSERMVIERDLATGVEPMPMTRYPMRLGGPIPLFAVLANLGAASRERSERSLDGDEAFEARVLSFAGRHGLLSRGVKVTMPNGKPGFAEPMALWERESRAIGDVLKRWQPEAERVVPSWRTDDERLTVQRTINSRIGADGGAVARLLWHSNEERLVLRLVPGTLLGALWLQLARWIDVGARFVRCRHCARWISLHPDSAIGRRSQTRTCSERCRKAHHDASRRRS